MGQNMWDGLIAAYPFWENGGLPHDVFRRVNATTTEGGTLATWQHDKEFGGLVMDNTANDASIRTVDTTVFDVAGNASLAVWFKYSTSSSNAPMFNHGDGTNQVLMLYISHITANTTHFIIEVSGTQLNAQSSNTYNDGNWHLALGVFDGSNVLLRMDGDRELVTGDATSGPIDTHAETYFFNYSAVNTNGFPGRIGQILVYNRDLTLAESVKLYRDRFAWIRPERRAIWRAPVAAAVSFPPIPYTHRRFRPLLVR